MPDLEKGTEYIRTLDYLRRLCSMREYCRRDVYEKAEKKLEDAAAAEEIVDTLVAEGFVDESRYASAFARDKAGIKGWGPLKIKSALIAKHIPSELVNAALSEIDSSRASDKLNKALEIKAKSLSSDPQIRLKLLRFGLSRGYTYDQLNDKISEILKKNS